MGLKYTSKLKDFELIDHRCLTGVGMVKTDAVGDVSPSPDGGLKGADRVLAVLKALGSFPDGVGLIELSELLESPKSSIHRALGALRRAEFVEQDGEGRYRLNYRFLKLAFAYYGELDDTLRIRPVLAQLAAHFGETTHYAVRDGAEVVYLAKVQPADSRFQMTSVIGGRNPAHCTGVGKTLLAYSLHDLAAVERFVDQFGPLERRTPHTLVDAVALDAEFATIRASGYGFDREENELGINCMALALFLTSSSVPDGAISITALAQRLPAAQLGARVDEARTIIRENLGDVLL